MKRGYYGLIFFTILIFSLLLKIIPTADNNFYFTMDQGNDAVHAREILARHQILLLGPMTGLPDLYAGPAWYYFISIGYFLFKGHPFGPVFLLILLNTFLTGVIIWQIAKKVSPPIALAIGAILQIFWPFYDTSRYAFNPFPLVFLSFTLIFLLSTSLEGKKNSFILAAIPIGLAFHTEVAGALALILFYLIIGWWLIFRRQISGTIFLLGIFCLAVFFLPHIISELTSDFSQTHAFLNHLGQKAGPFSGTNFQLISQKFLELVGTSAIPQNIKLGVALFLIINCLFWFFQKNKTIKSNNFVNHFTLLSLALLLVSWFWFSTNKGWQSWQTVYIPPILFVSLLLMVFCLPRRFGGIVLVLILISQVIFFRQLYWEYLRPSNDASILKNEIASIDWVYQKSQGLGFYVYNYLPSVLDYPYQYLFWWYGQKNYHYLPCEYSTFPGTPDLFIPGLKYYLKPKRDCSPLRFLIVEPDKNEFLRQQWLDQLREGTKLIEETNIGLIKLEKRQITKKDQVFLP